MSNVHSGVREFKEYVPNSKPYAPRISEAEWDRHKPVLTQLRTQGLPCAEIARSVAASHDFRPTVTQLNTRFRLWGLSRRSMDNLTQSGTDISQITPPEVHLAVSDDENVVVQGVLPNPFSFGLERPHSATSLAASSTASKAQNLSETSSSDEEGYDNELEHIILEQEAKRNVEDEAIAEISKELSRCFGYPFNREHSLETISMLPLELVKSLTCFLKSIIVNRSSLWIYWWHGCPLTPGIEFNHFFLDWAYMLLISSQMNKAYEHGWLTYIFLCWEHGSMHSSQKEQALLLCKRAALYMKDTPGRHALIRRVINYYGKGNGRLHCEDCVASVELEVEVPASRCLYLIHAPLCPSTAGVSPNRVYNVDDNQGLVEMSEFSEKKQQCDWFTWILHESLDFVMLGINDPEVVSKSVSEAMQYDEMGHHQQLIWLTVLLRGIDYNVMRYVLDELVKDSACACIQCDALRSDIKSGSILTMVLATYLLMKPEPKSQASTTCSVDSHVWKRYPENLYEEGYRALYVAGQHQQRQPLSAETFPIEPLLKAFLKHYKRSETDDFNIQRIPMLPEFESTTTTLRPPPPMEPPKFIRFPRLSVANLDAVSRYAKARHKRSTDSQMSIESSMQSLSTGGTSTIFHRLAKRLKKNPPRLERTSPSWSLSSSRFSSK